MRRFFFFNEKKEININEARCKVNFWWYESLVQGMPVHCIAVYINETLIKCGSSNEIHIKQEQDTRYSRLFIRQKCFIRVHPAYTSSSLSRQ